VATKTELAACWVNHSGACSRYTSGREGGSGTSCVTLPAPATLTPSLVVVAGRSVECTPPPLHQLQRRYIKFLEADLEEFGANDTRSLYYLGIGWFDVYEKTQQLNGVPVEQPTKGTPAWEALEHSMSYFKRRAAIVEDVNSSVEQRWFTIMKMGEMYERYYHNRRAAVRHYLQCARTDAERSDGWFLAGQAFRLMGNPRAALPLLMTAVGIPMPQRVMFHWAPMYGCVPQGELGNAVAAIPVTEEEVAAAAAPRERARPRQLTAAGLTGKRKDGSAETEQDVVAAVEAPDGVVAALLRDPPHLQRYHIEAAIKAAERAQRSCPPSESGVLDDLKNVLPYLRQQLAEYRRLEAVVRKKAVRQGASVIDNSQPQDTPDAQSSAEIDRSGSTAMGHEVRAPPSPLGGAAASADFAVDEPDRFVAIEPRGEATGAVDARRTCRQVRAATVRWRDVDCATVPEAQGRRSACTAAVTAYRRCVVMP